MVAIILAGGFGKRLKNKINNIPKPMAARNDRPFLDYIFLYLKKYGVTEVILSVFYKSEIIKQNYGSNYNGIKIIYSDDEEPLGTGGAILKALSKTEAKDVFIINGDTYFDVDLSKLMDNHKDNKNDITLSVKQMSNFDRYGFIEVDPQGKVLAFEEKKYQDHGLIDGGIYVIINTIFEGYRGDKKFLFTDFLRNNLNRLLIGSVPFDDLFIDIGTPEDFEKAQNLLKDYL